MEIVSKLQLNERLRKTLGYDTPDIWGQSKNSVMLDFSRKF